MLPADPDQAFAFFQSIVIFFAVSKGFGTSIELLGQGDINTVQHVRSGII